MSREDKSTQLPWEALEHTKGDIPWSALEQFADAVGSAPSVTDKLIKMYEQSFDLGPDHFGQSERPAKTQDQPLFARRTR